MQARFTAAFAAVLAAALMAAPAKADNDVGCGVGTLIMEGQKGPIPHLMASFTNGLTFQSISVAFGLLNCNGQDTVTADAGLRRFAAANIDRIALDAARGGGDTLDALASLKGIAPGDRAAFARLLQARFAQLFPSERTTSNGVLRALDTVLASDPQLARYAQL